MTLFISKIELCRNEDIGPVHTNTFSKECAFVVMEKSRSIRVHITVFMRFRLSTLKRSKTIELHVVTYVELYAHAGADYPEPPYVLYPWVNPFRRRIIFRTGFPAKIHCFRERPHIAVVRKKNGVRRGKLANKFSACSTTVFLYIFYPFLLLLSREAGYQLKQLIYDCNESVGIYPACIYCPG